MIPPKASGELFEDRKAQQKTSQDNPNYFGGKIFPSVEEASTDRPRRPFTWKVFSSQDQEVF